MKAQHTGTNDNDAWSLFTILPFLFGLLIINILQVRNLLIKCLVQTRCIHPFKFIFLNIY